MARRTDHLSSHVAADKLEASGAAQSQRAEALALVTRWPGMSSKQLARLANVDRYRLGRRLPELLREGRVKAIKAGTREICWFPA